MTTRISYREYKTKYANLKTVKDSYDAATKTIEVKADFYKVHFKDDELNVFKTKTRVKEIDYFEIVVEKNYVVNTNDYFKNGSEYIKLKNDEKVTGRLANYIIGTLFSGNIVVDENGNEHKFEN